MPRCNLAFKNLYVSVIIATMSGARGHHNLDSLPRTAVQGLAPCLLRTLAQSLRLSPLGDAVN